jgi:DNA-directed RNA polymerase, mitochondrial
MDFRGRVYPIPPHLNHMGADLNRGMLEFSEGKPLGEEGLRWLKIHLANKIGKDKLPLDERAAYAEEIIEEVH